MLLHSQALSAEEQAMQGGLGLILERPLGDHNGDSIRVQEDNQAPVEENRQVNFKGLMYKETMGIGPICKFKENPNKRNETTRLTNG